MPLMDRILHYWSMSQMTCPSGRERFTLVSSQNSTNQFLLERTYQCHPLSAVVKTECLPKGFSIHRVSQKNTFLWDRMICQNLKMYQTRFSSFLVSTLKGFHPRSHSQPPCFCTASVDFQLWSETCIFSKAVVTWKCPEDHWKLLSSKVASFHSFRKLIFVNPIFEREAINHEKSVRTLLGHLGKGRI